jgi:hypothetical protein
MSKPLGGGAATPAQRQHARDVLAASADQLANVRAAAGRWQAGLAGLTGTIAIFGLVRGRDDVAGLPGGWGVAYGICLALAVGFSVAGGVLAMRSAFGLPRVLRTSAADLTRWSDAGEARRSAALLRVAVWLTVLSIGSLAAALGIAWYASSQNTTDVLVHERSGGEDCGKLVRLSDGILVLDTDTGRRRLSVVSLDGIAGTNSCPAGG